MIQSGAAVSIPMAATLGFVYGMGPCLLCCLPFLSPVFLAHNGGVRSSWKIILPLSAGRLTAYALLGLAAGTAGQYVKGSISENTVRIVIGCAVLMMGAALLLRFTQSRPEVNSSAHCMKKIAGSKSLLPGGLFLMGGGMALSPCGPLGVVLFSAGTSGSGAGGLLLGISFGLGAITVPAVFYGIGMAYMGTRLREELQGWRPKIELISALLLVATGISNVFRW